MEKVQNTNGKSRIHIKKHLPEYGAEVNCFGDTALEAVALLLGTLEVLENPPDPLPTLPSSPAPMNQAQRELKYAEQLANAPKANASPSVIANAVKQSPRPQAKSQTGNSTRPVCQSCGASDAMELIRWADKQTQEAKSAWKCQACQTWAK